MRFLPFIFVFILAGVFAIPASAAAQEDPVVIVTEEESKQPDAPGRKRRFGSDGPAQGPIITFNKPTYGSEVEKPVTIDISFGARLAPVDISTLKVTYLKLLSIDITDRVREYADATGIRISNASFPTGTHKVR